MKSKTPESQVVVNLDEVRRKRQEKNAKFSKEKADEAESPQHTGLTPERANSISLKEAFVIARAIVKKYSSSRSLLSAYLARKKREASVENTEEFHVVFKRQKDWVALYTTSQLRAFLALYARNPMQFYEIYALSAAEEYIRRFPKGGEG